MVRIKDALALKPRRHALLAGNPGDTKHLAELGG
jgi:hypothetical protein